VSNCNVDGRIKWLGNLDKLKKFVFSLLGDGKWRSPGGSAKAFRNERIELTWYANKKTLFQGILGNKLKESIINSYKNNDMVLDANPNSDKPEAVSSSNNNISTNNIHSQRSVLHPPNTEQVSQIQNQSTECLKCCHLAAEMAETMQKVDGLSIMMNKVYQCVSSLLTKNNVTAASGRENIRDSSTQVNLFLRSVIIAAGLNHIAVNFLPTLRVLNWIR
jgi:hypothetical protein